MPKRYRVPQPVVTFGTTCGVLPAKGAYGRDVRQTGGAPRNGSRNGGKSGRRSGKRPFLRRLRRRVKLLTSQVTSSGWARRTGIARLSLGTAGSSPWLRRGALAAALLVIVFLPYPSQSTPSLVNVAGCRTCHAGEQNMLRWTLPLTGSWDVESGLAGTVPSGGQAYAAVGSGVAAIGTGLTVDAYTTRDHALLWQDTLTGFPSGAAIISVRTWPYEVTVGVSYPGRNGATLRTEVVLPDSSGAQESENEYPAASFGGAVAGNALYTVIVGSTSVTSYDNETGRIRWQRPIATASQGWQTDGQYLYVTESAGSIRMIDTTTGAEQEIVPSSSSTLSAGTAVFDGTLNEAFDGVLLFSDAGGVTAYSGSTGAWLWSTAGAVPDGADPIQHRIYLTKGSSLLSVNPLDGKVKATAPGLGTGMYVVRGGVALGLDPDANGAAWGYDLGAQRVVMAASGLGWPHFFADLSGVGGSAGQTGRLVVIAACAEVGPIPQPTPSPTPSSSALLSGPPSPPSPPSPTSSETPSGQASPGQTSPGQTSSGQSSPGQTASGLTSPSQSASASPSSAVTLPQPCLKPELIALNL
jgi:PQQ-like domain